MEEPLIKDGARAVQDYLHQIEERWNKGPFLIYGHSLGAILGLKIALNLELTGSYPEALCVSGSAGPGVRPDKERYLMNKHDLKIELRHLGGVSDAVLENQELYDLIYPMMQADFEILEKDPGYYTEGKLSNTSIIASMGDEEEGVGNIANWQHYTEKDSYTIVLPGNHFFIQQIPEQIAKLIRNASKGDMP